MGDFDNDIETLDIEKQIHYRYALRNQFDNVRDTFRLLEETICNEDINKENIMIITEELIRELRTMLKLER